MTTPPPLAVSPSVLELGGSRFHQVAEPDHTPLIAALRACMGAPPQEHNREHRAFPGANPVSIERCHFAQLTGETYWVAEKTDGMRYLLFCTVHNTRKLCLLVDRKLCMYVAGLHMPTACYQGSVLDGEVALNKSTGGWDYLIFDGAAVSGVPLARQPFLRRLQYIAACFEDFSPPPPQPLRLRIKRFFPVATSWADFKEHYEHVVPPVFKTDGLIFTPDDCPYVYGRHLRQFKWKAGPDNTIDFQVVESDPDPSRLRLGIMDRGRVLNVATIERDSSELARSLRSGDVVECERTAGNWRPRMLRTDKSHPNDLLTYERTLVNIQEDIRLAEFDALFLAP